MWRRKLLMVLFFGFSGLLISLGVALFPIGWGNKEVLDACNDESGPYYLGKSGDFKSYVTKSV